MYILAIETTGKLGSVAISDEKGNMTEKRSSQAMNHLKELMPMAQQLIDELGISKKDLGAIAASTGPGSFTGIRIGVSSARALAQVLEIPAVAVPTLDTFREKCAGSFVVSPIFNARRGQVYGAVFDKDESDLKVPGPYMLTDIFDCIRENLGNFEEGQTIMFYGDGIDAYGKEIEEFRAEIESRSSCRIECAPEECRYQNAKMVAALALRKIEAGETCGYGQLLPDYMRKTEAEQKLEDGTLAKERKKKMERLGRAK